MDQTPVVLAGHRIEITLAQETLAVVGVRQLVDGVGVAAILFVIEADGADVLFASLDGFRFLVAAQFGRDLGRRNRQGQHNKQDHDQHRKQDEAFLMLSMFSRSLLKKAPKQRARRKIMCPLLLRAQGIGCRLCCESAFQQAPRGSGRRHHLFSSSHCCRGRFCVLW
jgi:hypothetical protein